MHEEAVLCSAFSRDGEYLATGAQSGTLKVRLWPAWKCPVRPFDHSLPGTPKNPPLKVWKLATGLCVKRLSPAHPQGITSVAFARDGAQVRTPLARLEMLSLALHALTSRHTNPSWSRRCVRRCPAWMERSPRASRRANPPPPCDGAQVRPPDSNRGSSEVLSPIL